MKNFFKRTSSENISEEAQLREVDERHFLSQQIFIRRQQLEWSQDDLARCAGLTQAQVATLEAGQANPTLRTLAKLAAAFGCTVGDLLQDTSPQYSCTAADRAAAEALQIQSSPLYSWDDPRWEEERRASEFVLMEGLHTMPASGQGGFHAFHMRHTLMRNQHAVSLHDDASRVAELNDYDDAVTEL